MLWLNIDLATSIWKLHDENCIYCKPKRSLNKGIDLMGRNGGWFSFKSYSEAKEFYEKKGKTQIWQPCKVCKPEKIPRN
jgi:hypothetical protein